MDENISIEEALNYELIPSARKQEGWQAFSAQMPYMMKNPKDTAAELKYIHRALNSHYDLTLHPFVEQEMIRDLYILDRPDAEEMDKKSVEVLKKIGKLPNIEHMHPMQSFMIYREKITEICKENTEIKFNPTLIGELRSFGTRKIDDYPEETVYCSHTCVFSSAAEDFAITTGVHPFPPTSYYGLSVNLDKTYQKFCDKYDAIIKESDSFEEKVLAQGFLQSLGTRTIHPFFDGNGRTFGAQLALTLNRHEVDLKDYETVALVGNELTNNTNNLLKEVLKSAELDFISDSWHFTIKMAQRSRADYMSRLNGAINEAIELGIEPEGKYYSYISNAAKIIESTVKSLKIRA